VIQLLTSALSVPEDRSQLRVVGAYYRCSALFVPHRVIRAIFEGLGLTRERAGAIFAAVTFWAGVSLSAAISSLSRWCLNLRARPARGRSIFFLF